MSTSLFGNTTSSGESNDEETSLTSKESYNETYDKINSKIDVIKHKLTPIIDELMQDLPNKRELSVHYYDISFGDGLTGNVELKVDCSVGTFKIHYDLKTLKTKLGYEQYI